MAADIAADVAADIAVDMTVDMFVATHGNIHALPWQVVDSRGSARRARRRKIRTCPRVSAIKSNDVQPCGGGAMTALPITLVR